MGKIKRTKSVIGNEQIVQLAKAQNKNRLYSEFSNIEHITGKMIDDKRQLTIYVNDDNIEEIPKTVKVQLNKNNFTRIRTNIVPAVSREIRPLINSASISDSRDIFVGNVDSICCLATDGESTVAVTTAHGFYGKISGNDWFPKSSYKTNIGYVIYYNYNLDIAIIVLKGKLNIPKFAGKTIPYLKPDDNTNIIFSTGQKDIRCNFKHIDDKKFIKYDSNDKLGYGDSGSYVCFKGCLIGMHLGKDANLLDKALPWGIIEKVLQSQNFKII